MIQNIKSIGQLMLFFSLLLMACNSAESKEQVATEAKEKIDTEVVGETHVDPEPDTASEPTREWVKWVDNEGVGFEWGQIKTTEYGENFEIHIECLVTNHTDKEINYLCQSCNDLEFFLMPQPETYQVMPLMNCYMTWGIIKKLGPGESLSFSTQLLKLKDAEPLEKIGLDFRALDTFIPFDTLRDHPERIETIYRSDPDRDQVIWSTEN